MSDKKIDYDLLIIGSGPAGMTAALYGKRAGLNLGLIEGTTPGGNLVVTGTVENYPGIASIKGPDLAIKMFEQISALGVSLLFSKVINVKKHDSYFEIFLANKKVYTSRFLFVASGMNPIKPDIPSLIAKEQKGVSYCAICDGALYKDKEVIVIGGGNSAVDESFFLLSICKKTHVVIRRDVFRADPITVKKLLKHANVVVHYDSLVYEVHGDELVDGVTLINVKTKKKTKLPHIKAVFPYIGQKPNTDFLKEMKITNEKGFIPVDRNCKTKIKNLYAIGDVNVKELRQIITAVSDGGVAIKHIISRI